jgi:hypothetical protein
MEFSYLPLAALAPAPGVYDWKPLESLLDGIAARGHQAVFRIYLEYPGEPSGVPGFLLRDGLKLFRPADAVPGKPPAYETPDYRDPRLRQLLRDFVRELGRRYDGDPRIGYITAGLLGAWGEWHTYPRTDLFPGKDVQREVMEAYTRAFRITPVLLRNPAGPGDPVYAPNDDAPFGYHDDSFAWATLATDRKEDDWFFQARLRQAGSKALHKWRRHPIGGEIRPEAWGRVFDPVPGHSEIQDFARCVEATHVSWLMDSGMFQPQPQERVQRAMMAVRRMGYELTVSKAALTVAPKNLLEIRATVHNRGVAPFYYDWPVEFGLLAPDGSLVKTKRSRGWLKSVQPGEPPRVWRERLELSQVPRGSYRALVRIPNPLPKGRPLRFANSTQDKDLPEWLTLGSIIVR